MKIVINKCYGGFGLSHQAIMRYAELKNLKLYHWIDNITKEVYGEKATLENPSVLIHYTKVPPEEYERVVEEEKEKPIGKGKFAKSHALYFSPYDIPRDDTDLIKVVKELKDKANRRCANLKIVTIPDDVKWQIEEYDGYEHIAECHKTWR